MDLDDFTGTDDAPWGFADCWALPTSPDDPCAVHDIDQNGTVDMGDYDSLLLAWDDAFEDCDGDGVLDLLELLEGTQLDADDNGVPDDCETDCGSDLDGDGGVGVNDLLLVIGDWGLCPNCIGDVYDETMVNVDDLLLIIAAWGPCQFSP